MVKRTNGWHQTSGKWSRSLGERGMRVRLFQKRRGGTFYRAVWFGGRRDVKPLHTRDRNDAERSGRAFLAELLRGELRVPERSLTLGELWERFSRQAVEFLDNKPRTQHDFAARVNVMLGFFGADFDVTGFTPDHQRRYQQARLLGGIALEAGGVTVPTRARSPEADVAALHMMLRWATTVRRVDGTYLLDRNPLQHVRRLREKNRRQPYATIERFVATRDTMRRLQRTAAKDEERAMWVRMEFALFLAEATGRRLGSIRALRWEDFEFDTCRVVWRSEADKKGVRWEVQMPERFFDDVRSFQRTLRAVGGPVFAAPRSADGMMDRHLFDKWLSFAEKEAGLPKLTGGLWHAYRRKWAIERKHLPLRDVAAAGGWSDVSVLLEIYQQPDPASVLSVMSETRKLSDKGLQPATARETAPQTAPREVQEKTSPA